MKLKYRIIDFIIITELVTALYITILVLTSLIAFKLGLGEEYGMHIVLLVLGILGYPIGKILGRYVPRISHRIKLWEQNREFQGETRY